MPSAPKTSTCARCASRLDERFRFCPECGLPVTATGVLSTQIHEVRPKEQPVRRSHDWTRLLLPSGATLMLVFVVGLGLVLYNRELLDRVFPQPDDPVVDGRPAMTAGWEPDWVWIPPGIAPIGPPTAEGVDQPTWSNHDGFFMSRFEVTNAQWAEFLELAETDLRKRGLWEDADPGPTGGWDFEGEDIPVVRPGTERYPVRNISLTIAIEYCRWLTRRLSDPDWEIRLPRNVEWEFAARGSEGRRYPWGDAFELPAAPKLRRDPAPPPGINASRPLPVDAVTSDRSPFGVVGMGTNVMEWAISDVEWDDLQVLAPKQGFKRGASFAFNNDAKGARMAQTWNLPRVEARLPQGDLGFRLVKARRSELEDELDDDYDEYDDEYDDADDSE